jgi:hypothetical protein
MTPLRHRLFATDLSQNAGSAPTADRTWGRSAGQHTVGKLLNRVGLAETSSPLEDGLRYPVRERNRPGPVRAVGGVLLVHHGERIRSDPVDQTYESGPETPVDQRELSLDETKPDHIVGRRGYVQDAEDLVVLRVPPPAARDATAHDELREVHDRSPCRLEHHTVLFYVMHLRSRLPLRAASDGTSRSIRRAVMASFGAEKSPPAVSRIGFLLRPSVNAARGAVTQGEHHGQLPVSRRSLRRE